jgi:DNA adenine methylase
MKPPIVYYGGKTRLASQIAALLQQHRHYVEVCGGSLALLLAKRPARLETANDLDTDLMTFWTVLRDRPDELMRACAFTPHARQEARAARELPDDLDDLERARRVWVLLTQSRASTYRPTGWRHHVAPDRSATSMARYLTGYLRRMETVARRLREVSLECRPALEVIDTYGRHADVLLYVDPPYLRSARTSTNYRHELPHETEHRALATALRACKATVVVSGYPSALYDQELFPDWHRHQLHTGTGQGGRWATRTEVLWSNRPFTARCNETPACAQGCNETPCAVCGDLMPQPRVGRPRRYCSGACRVRAHRLERSSA